MYRKDITSYGIIYKATNKVNGKIYIGQTTYSFKARKWQHKHQAFDKNDTKIFYQALRKYGWEKFKWCIIDNANNIEDLNEKEIYWVDHYDSYVGFKINNGYNMTIGGESTIGFKHSDEQIKYLRETNTGLKNYNCKTTIDIVIKVKELLRDTDLFYSEIANTVGLSRSSVSNIYQGRNWSSVEVEGFKINMFRDTSKKFSENSRKNILNTIKQGKICKLTYEQAQTIRELNKNGYTRKELSEKYNVCRQTIANIINDKHYTTKEQIIS